MWPACLWMLTLASSLAAALEGSDALILLVPHTPLKNLRPEDVAALTAARLVIDTVNGWDPKEWEKAGFRVVRLGVGNS